MQVNIELKTCDCKNKHNAFGRLRFLKETNRTHIGVVVVVVEIGMATLVPIIRQYHKKKNNFVSLLLTRDDQNIHRTAIPLSAIWQTICLYYFKSSLHLLNQTIIIFFKTVRRIQILHFVYQKPNILIGTIKFISIIC